MTVSPTQDDQKPRLRDLDEEGLRARLRDRTERVKERSAKKVTAADVLAQQEQRKQERAAKRASKTKPQKRRMTLSLGAGIALMVVAGATMVAAVNASDNAVRIEAEHDAQVAELKSQLHDLDADETGAINTDSQLTEKVVTDLEQVRKVSDEVAKRQNGFAELKSANRKSAGGGALSQGSLDAAEHRASLSEFFAEVTYVLSDEELTSPATHLDIEEGVIDPRMQWYARDLDAGKYGWATTGVTPVGADALGLASVTWLCQDDKTGDLLAWATGTWSAQANTFIDLSVGTTTVGDQQSENARVGSVS